MARINGILYGLEIEGEYFDVSGWKTRRIRREGSSHDYHTRLYANDKKTVWNVCGDGSLRARKGGSCYELKNARPLGEVTLLKQLKLLREGLEHGREELELKDVLSFNNSSGLHFHFSKTGLTFSRRALLPTIIKTRKKFKRLLLDSDIPHKNAILQHYNRRFAVENRNNENISDYLSLNCRYSEFNFKSEIEKNQGLEWRAPNALYIKTWDNLFKLIKIYLQCIKYFVRRCSQPQRDSFITTLTIDIKDEDDKKIIVNSERFRTVCRSRPLNFDIRIYDMGGF